MLSDRNFGEKNQLIFYMESMNQTIKNTLHFVAVIQDACDKKRLHIERRNSQGLNAFVKEWRNEKSTRPPKKAELVIAKNEPEAPLLEEEMEELALVDSLLEKARNIRLKNKNLLKKGENSPKRTPSGTEACNNVSKSNVESQRQKSSKRIEESSFNRRPVPRSKSASLSTKLKTSVVPRSKSANIKRILNGDEKVHVHRTYAKPVSRNGGTVRPPWQNGGTVCDVSSAAVLSPNELHEFKNIHSAQNSCKTTTTEKMQNTEELKSLNSDLNQYPDQQSIFPTYRKFLRKSQQKFISKSSYRMQICGLWYPFLSLKSQKYLLDQPDFLTLDSFTKAVKLIHQIQETMLWIDLLSLVGREAVPNLNMLDDNDWNVIRLSSYLESIYNQNLQRTPLLDPN